MRASGASAIPSANRSRICRFVSDSRSGNKVVRHVQSAYTSERRSAAPKPWARISGAVSSPQPPGGAPGDVTLTSAGIFDNSKPVKIGALSCRTRMVRRRQISVTQRLVVRPTFPCNSPSA